MRQRCRILLSSKTQLLFSQHVSQAAGKLTHRARGSAQLVPAMSVTYHRYLTGAFDMTLASESLTCRSDVTSISNSQN
jgi:hypothetical protein